MNSKPKGLLRFRRSANYLMMIALAVSLIVPMQRSYAVGMHNVNITPASAYTEFAEMFPSVGYIFGQNGGADVDFFSGVLIHPNFVLTAGHGVLANTGSTQFEAYDVGFGPSILSPTESNFADEVFVHPDYAGVEAGVDLALLYFETPFSLTPTADIFSGQAQVGDVASIVGYGQPGSPNTGTQTPDGVKRAGQNVIESNTAFDDYLFYRFRSQGDNNFLPLGSQGLPGDSGGGWFIETVDGFELAGITSGGTGAVGYGFRTSAVQVAPGEAWINDTIASKSVPKPSSVLLLGAASLAFFRRRKRA